MKKNSVISKKVAVFMIVIFLFLVFSECTKEGVLVKNLDRAIVPDSTEFASFYDVTKIDKGNGTPDINDSIVIKGVLSIVQEYCGISTCHGGPINPKLANYNDIKSLVLPGNPEGSKLWELLTTNEINRAMPPVSAAHELPALDKSIIYNWIKTGAKEAPGLENFRPAAIRIITSGCTSGNCHNIATSTGAWARKVGLLDSYGIDYSKDTGTFALVRPTSVTYYCQITNAALRNKVWSDYKDSVKRFFADTLGNASFRPYKTFSTPVVLSSVRGPLSSYDDILFDISYPKGIRSVGTNPVYTDPSGKKFYVRGNLLNGTSTLISRVDSTLNPANLYTGIFVTNNNGDMAYSDGGLKRSEIAIIKAWYFADPNIPDIWKYGNSTTGLFKYKRAPFTIIGH